MVESTIASKNTMFQQKTLLSCCGKLLDLSFPQVMGIVNVTPDSFYDGGQLKTESDILKHAETMVSEGAVILDIGGMSSRPGAELLEQEDELRRVIPAVQSIHRHFPEIILSVDTWRSRIAEESIAAGASLINDISAGRWDPLLLLTVARLKIPYVLMHMQGIPATMQENPSYSDVVSEVYHFMKEKISELNTLGIYDIVIDPGFGFGKTVEHNFQLLKHLDLFTTLGLPLMAGLSRKSMICKPLHVNPGKALNGTTALHAVALLQGAKLLRVHDVKEAKEVIELIKML
jgi:dihydropteroate synthase